MLAISTTGASQGNSRNNPQHYANGSADWLRYSFLNDQAGFICARERCIILCIDPIYTAEGKFCLSSPLYTSEPSWPRSAPRNAGTTSFVTSFCGLAERERRPRPVQRVAVVVHDGEPGVRAHERPHDPRLHAVHPAQVHPEQRRGRSQIDDCGERGVGERD